MKTFLALLLLSTSTFAVKFKQLDIKAGLWRHEIVENSAIDKMLEKVPEAQRAMMKSMMKEKMNSYDACQTPEMLKDPEGKFKEAVAKKPEMKGCEFVILKSSSKYNHSKIKCPEKKLNMDIKIEVLNEKEQKQTVLTNVPQPNSNIVVRARWVGECKEEDLPQQ
ncbi:MAG: DUF3617 family protein [Halobacteriovoraceae bacterium]|nr:DUF3617 family protein [Halobacteriovoraceae bacterium]